MAPERRPYFLSRMPGRAFSFPHMRERVALVWEYVNSLRPSLIVRAASNFDGAWLLFYALFETGKV